MKDRSNLYRDAFEVELAGVPVCMAQPRGVGAHRFLLLHGNPGSMHLDFGALVGPLGRLGQVVAFDMPGLGRSPTPNRREELSLERLAEVALAAIDLLEWERTVVVGHSHGGGVAQRLAARWPDRIAGLVLIGTLGAPAHGSYKLLPLPGVDRIVGLGNWLLPRLPASIRPNLVRAFMDPAFAPGRASDAEIADYCALLTEQPHILRNMAWLTRGNPCRLLARDAHRIAAPTLILHGKADPVVPIRHGRAVSELIHGARFVELEGGHALPSRTPGRIVAEIASFLKAFAG